MLIGVYYSYLKLLVDAGLYASKEESTKREEVLQELDNVSFFLNDHLLYQMNAYFLPILLENAFRNHCFIC